MSKRYLSIALYLVLAVVFTCAAKGIWDKEAKASRAAVARKLELAEFRKTFMALCLNDDRPVYQCMSMYSSIKPSDWTE